MSKRVEQYKEDLQRVGNELVELLELAKKMSPNKGFEKRDGSFFTRNGLTQKKLNQLQEQDKKNRCSLSSVSPDAEHLAIHNQAMSDIDTQIDGLKIKILNLNSCLNQNNGSFKEQVQACFDSIINFCGYDSEAKPLPMGFPTALMCSDEVKRNDLMSLWERIQIDLTLAIRAFFNFFDEVQSLVTKKVMNDARETPGARQIRTLFHLESRSQFFPEPLLSINAALAEWIVVRDNLLLSLKAMEESGDAMTFKS